jgi:hypothetical protein
MSLSTPGPLRVPLKIVAMNIDYRLLERAMFDETVWWAEDWEPWLRLRWIVPLAVWLEPMSIYTKHSRQPALTSN